MRWLRPGGWSAPLLTFGVMTAGGLSIIALTRPGDEVLRLESQQKLMLRSFEDKLVVGRRVVGGTCTLIEAAVEIRRINRRFPHAPVISFPLHDPTATDVERHCWEVVRWVEHALLGKPAEANEWADRLMEEIERRRADGTLTLPADDPP